MPSHAQLEPPPLQGHPRRQPCESPRCRPLAPQRRPGSLLRAGGMVSLPWGCRPRPSRPLTAPGHWAPSVHSDQAAAVQPAPVSDPWLLAELGQLRPLYLGPPAPWGRGASTPHAPFTQLPSAGVATPRGTLPGPRGHAARPSSLICPQRTLAVGSMVTGSLQKTGGHCLSKRREKALRFQGVPEPAPRECFLSRGRSAADGGPSVTWSAVEKQVQAHDNHRAHQARGVLVMELRTVTRPG